MTGEEKELLHLYKQTVDLFGKIAANQAHPERKMTVYMGLVKASEQGYCHAAARALTAKGVDPALIDKALENPEAVSFWVDRLRGLK